MKVYRLVMRPVFLFLAVLFASGCTESKYDREFELDESNFDVKTMRQIEEMSGFIIPEGSRGLNFAYKPPVDPGFAARLEIPASSKNSVMEQIERIAGKPVTSNGGSPLHIKWWLPKRENVLAEKQVFNGGGNSSKAGYHHAILTREDENLMLYLHYHTP